MAVSRWAVLAMLFFSPWYLEWPIALPGIEAANVPFAANLPKLRPADVLAVITIGAYLLAGWPGRQRLSSSLTRGWALSLVGLVALAVLSVAWAPHQSLALAFMIHMALWVMVALRVACDDVSPKRIAASLLAGLLVCGGVGLAQFFAQHSVGLGALGEQPLDPAIPGVSVVGIGGVRLLRLYGLSGHPNVMGGYAALALVMSIGLILQTRRRRWIMMLLAWSIGWMVLLLSFSRSAWLAVSIGLGTLALALVRHRLDPRWMARAASIGVAMSAGVIAWGAALSPFLVARLSVSGSPTEQFSIEQRTDLFSTAEAMIAARPLTGVGIGNFSVASYGFTTPPHYLTWVHNVPLLIAAELGLPGLSVWLIGTTALVALGVRRWRAGPDMWDVLCGGAIASMLMIMLLDHYLWTSSQGVYLWAVMTGVWAGRATSPGRAG